MSSREAHRIASRPVVHLVRAASATLRAFLTGATPTDVAKAMYGNDAVTDLVLRAASQPAAISGTSAWAQSLAAVAVYDLIASVTSLSAAAAVIDRALKLNMSGVAELHVPGRALSAAAAGQWVGEGMATPVRAMSFANAAILRPRRLDVLSVVTREMAESSNIEAAVRQTLGEATGLALDLQMFSADAGDATKPPGLFAGVAPLTPTASGGDNALHGDIANLFAALAARGGGKTAVIVAAMPQAVRLKLIAGPKFDHDVVASTALATGTVAALEIASLVSGFASVAEFTASKVGVVHLEDTSPTDVTGGTPSPAAPVKSLFQIDAIGLKTTLWAAWGLRAAGHAQWIQGAMW